jgi:FtsZ-binding cell division protein ZapB
MPAKPKYYDELNGAIKVISERVDNLRREVGDLGNDTKDLTSAVAEIKKDIAVLQQQSAEQTKRTDEWDRRLWGLLAIMVGAILSLASGLIVALAKK